MPHKRMLHRFPCIFVDIFSNHVLNGNHHWFAEGLFTYFYLILDTKKVILRFLILNPVTTHCLGRFNTTVILKLSNHFSQLFEWESTKKTKRTRRRRRRRTRDKSSPYIWLCVHPQCQKEIRDFFHLRACMCRGFLLLEFWWWGEI